MTAPDPAAVLALALLRMEGVGRVTAGRLLARFPSAEALWATPREQVLLRLRGTPNAETLVARLVDGELAGLLEPARRFLEALAERRVAVLTERHPHWPTGLATLRRAERPVVLYAFGPTATLTRPQVALLARPPLPEAAFERAQDLVRRLLAAGVVPTTGLQHGFDAVVLKLAAGMGRPAVAVTSAGLRHVPTALRPAASAAVTAGGTLLAPFPPDHGPFPHDDVERARIMAAMARATTAFAPPTDAPEGKALRWALEHGRPTFVAPAANRPAGAHPLETEADLDRVLAAARDASAA